MHDTANNMFQTKKDAYKHSDNIIYISRKTRIIPKENFYQGLFHFLQEIELIDNSKEFRHFVLDNQENILEFQCKYHIT